MIPIEIPHKNIKMYLPESLGECNSREYIEINRLIFLYQSGKISFDQFLSLGVYAILNIRPSKSRESEEETTEKFNNIALLSDCLINFFEKKTVEGTETISIKLDFIHNPIQKLKLKGIPFIGPSDNFESVTFGQYLDGLTLFLDYAKHGEFNSLIKLLNIFYKPKFKFLQNKIKFTEKNTDTGIAFGFYHYFASFQKFITTAKIEVAGTEIDLSVVFSDSETEKYGSDLPGLGMKSLLFSISETGVFGTSQEVRETPLWEVLLRLYDIRKRAKDEKAEYDKMKTKSK